MNTVGGGSATLLTFRWGATRCAAPLEGVREVLRLRALVAVPGAVPPLAGLLDLRGQPLPVLDLAPLLLTDAEATPQPAPVPRDVLVVRRPDGALVGLLCDEVLGVVEADGTAPPPRGLPAYVTGVRPGPVPVVDLELLLASLAPGLGPSNGPDPGLDLPAAAAAEAASAAARASLLWTRDVPG